MTVFDFLALFLFGGGAIVSWPHLSTWVGGSFAQAARNKEIENERAAARIAIEKAKLQAQLESVPREIARDEELKDHIHRQELAKMEAKTATDEAKAIIIKNQVNHVLASGAMALPAAPNFEAEMSKAARKGEEDLGITSKLGAGSMGKPPDYHAGKTVRWDPDFIAFLKERDIALSEAPKWIERYEKTSGGLSATM